MQKNKFNQPPVRADLSRPAPIMQMNKIIRTSVGADLSCPSPIYRPSADVSISGLFCETSLSAFPRIYRYPGDFVKPHYCTLGSALRCTQKFLLIPSPPQA